MPFRSPKMNGFIFGFQRFVWWPKWTPASSRSFNAMPVKLPPYKKLPASSCQLPAGSWKREGGSFCLSLTALEPLARSFLSVLLALLDARIARQEARLLQPLPQLDVVLNQRARDPKPQRAGLSCDAAARDGREHIELVRGFGDCERLLDLGAERFGGEGLFERLAIHDHAAITGPEKYA